MSASKNFYAVPKSMLAAVLAVSSPGLFVVFAHVSGATSIKVYDIEIPTHAEVQSIILVGQFFAVLGLYIALMRDFLLFQEEMRHSVLAELRNLARVRGGAHPESVVGPTDIRIQLNFWHLFQYRLLSFCFVAWNLMVASLPFGSLMLATSFWLGWWSEPSSVSSSGSPD